MSKSKKKAKVVAKNNEQSNIMAIVLLGAIALIMSISVLSLGNKVAKLGEENRALQQEITAHSCNCAAYKK
jgi:hypothetical protein